MKPTQKLHDLGQSLWLDNITRTILDDGTLERYIDELVGHRADLQPHHLRQGDHRRATPTTSRSPSCARRASSPRTLFFELAIADLQRAADLFAGVHAAHRRRRRLGLARGLAAAGRRHRGDHRSRRPSCTRRAGRENLFIKIPGTEAGLPAIEESIFAGVPINVTLLFDREQYLAAADAYMRGIERRIEAGLDPAVRLGRLDLHEPLGRGGRRRGARPSSRTGSGSRSASRPTPPTASCSTPSAGSAWPNEGARPQRLLFASTGTKDPEASDVLYVEAFAAPDTINTMPEKTLLAFADHGEVGEPLARRRRRRRGGPGRVRARPGSTSTRWRPGSRRRGRRRSSSPGTTCSARSRAEKPAVARG